MPKPKGKPKRPSKKKAKPVKGAYQAIEGTFRGLGRFALVSIIVIFLMWNTKGNINLSYDTSLPKPSQVKWSKIGKSTLSFGKGAIQMAQGAIALL